MKFNIWLQEAFEKTNEALIECFNNSLIGGWSENHITTQVLDSLKNIGCEFDWDDKPQKIKWEGLKLKGKLESSFGDIAILVKVWLTSEISVEGVAFYEAKKQYFNAGGEFEGFKAIDKKQLSKISSQITSCQVLLYDVDISKKQANLSSLPCLFVEKLKEQMGSKYLGRTIGRYGKAWVVALGDNLLGLNLDFRPQAVDAVKNAVKYNQVPYVLNASVAMLNIFEPKLSDSFSKLDNYEVFTPVEKEIKPQSKPRNDGPKL